MTTNNFCFYLQNKLIQTSQTGVQLYNDTSPFIIPCCDHTLVMTSPFRSASVFLTNVRQGWKWLAATNTL